MELDKNKIPPETWKKIIEAAIAILTIIGGFFCGMGTATACQLIF